MLERIPKLQEWDISEDHQCINIGTNRVTGTRKDVFQQEEEVETQRWNGMVVDATESEQVPTYSWSDRHAHWL